MAKRGLTAASITALGADVVEFYNLLRIDFSVPLYYTNAPYDITYDGNIYLSSSVLDDFPAISESLKIKPQTLSVKLSGTSVAMHALMLSENYKNAEVYYYRYIVATAQTVLLYLGYCDSYDSSEDTRGTKSVITLSIASHWKNWEATNGRQINDRVQQSLYSGDLGFEFSGVTETVLKWWGALAFWMTPTGVDGPAAYNDTGATDTEYRANMTNAYDWEAQGAELKTLPVIYGQKKVKGIPVFRALTGTQSQYMWVVYAIAEGECEALVNTQFHLSEEGKDWNDSEFNNSVVSVTFHAGTATQAADSTLVAAAFDWTANHRLLGVAYAVVKYDKTFYNWPGEPAPVFEVKGKKLYDTRTSVTSYSTNPALVSYDYMVSSSYGKALSSSEIDIDAIDSGANYCDTMRLNHDGSLGGTIVYIKTFDFNGTIDNAKAVKKNIESILFTMGAYLPWVNGKYKLVIERVSESSVYSFDGDNIKGKFNQGEKGINDLANEVHYTWFDAVDSVEVTELEESATYLSYDNSRKLVKKYKNKFENNVYRARARSTSLLKRARDFVYIKSLSSSIAESLQIESGGIVGVTRDSKGWVNKLFRVISLSLGNNGDNVFELEEYNSSSLDWAVSVEQSRPVRTALLNPNVVAAPTSFTVTATDLEAIVSSDNTTLHRLKLSWTEAVDAYVSGTHIQYREYGATDWIDRAAIDDKTVTVAYIDGALVGANYDVRIRSFNSLGNVSAWVEALNGAVTGTPVIGVGANLQGADAYGGASYFRKFTFESLDAWSLIGGPSIISTVGLRIRGGSYSEAVYRYFNRELAVNTWKKNRRFKTKLRFDDAQYLLTTGGETQINVSDATTAHQIRFKFNWDAASSKITIATYSQGSGSESRTAASTGVAISANTDFTVEFYYDYINGTISFTANDGVTEWAWSHTWSGGMPTSENPQQLFVWNYSNASGGTNNMYINEIASIVY